MKVDWRRDGGGVYRVLADDGTILGFFKVVEVIASSTLVSIEGHGWLVVNGVLEVDGETARIK
jgi:hypothetical protein